MCDNKTLKPCPFCGEMPHLEEDYESNFFAVYCGNPECVTKPYTDLYGTESEAIKAWNTRVDVENAKLRERITAQKQTIQAYRDESREWYEVAAHNQQLIDDIEKADSDYFKLKKNRDEWKDAFYKSVYAFKKLSEICDRLITARKMLMEEVNDLKDEIKNMDYDFSDSRERYESDIDALEDENEKLKNALESTEKKLNDYQETCDALTKENERLKNMIQLCGSY